MTKPVCAIVGAGEGLGRALAAKFASRDFDIALISRCEANSAAAVEAAATTASAANVRFFSADVSRPETLEPAIATIDREMGEIDLLIYNVRGTFTACEPLDMSYAALEEVYRVEVMGAFAAAKSV
ncbi:MAG: SDR family NAD(P)-dependent oxidoreductase, partial [Kiloniellales bacterium]|nr:SDR family NAD(P)-dependent oxidoreductase [Kiloniellales bacterium]